MRRLAIGVLALALAGCGGGGDGGDGGDEDESPARERGGALEILDVRYVPDARPRGADRTYPALVVRARDPDGQITAVTTDVAGAAGVADGRCGLGGKRSGEVETWTLPMRLNPGRHRVRVAVESSTCDAGDPEGERAVVERTIRVPR